MSIHGQIIPSLLKNALRPVVVDDRRSYRGIDILVAALHVASELEARCTSKTVGILLPTGGGFPICALAAWMVGKVPVPINYLLKQEELEYIINDCGTDTVLSAGPMLEFLGYEPRGATVLPLESIDFKSVPDLRWPAMAAGDDLAVLLYTSGTTGYPKGVMLSHQNIRSNLAQFEQIAKLTTKDVMLGVLPQFHSFGMTVLTLEPLKSGMKAVYAARFVPQQILKLFREHRPTVFVGIPSMYGALLRAKSATPDDFMSLRYAVSGGEPLPDAIADEFQDRFGILISEGYGLTETAPVLSVCLPGSYKRHSVGRLLDGIDHRIVCTDKGVALSPGSEGEIRVQGPNVMQGYFNLPEATEQVFDEHGYFRTGDIGKTDEDGYLYITGRLKEMLIVGGENVFPREIEDALNRHPAVGASAVIGRMDQMRGEVPIAFVEIIEGHAFDADELRSFCREHIAGYKVPKEVYRLDALPRNGTGKILRRDLVCHLPGESGPDTSGLVADGMVLGERSDSVNTPPGTPPPRHTRA